MVDFGAHSVRVRRQPPHFNVSGTAKENMEWTTTAEEAFEVAYLLEAKESGTDDVPTVVRACYRVREWARTCRGATVFEALGWEVKPLLDAMVEYMKSRDPVEVEALARGAPSIQARLINAGLWSESSASNPTNFSAAVAAQ